MVIGIKNTIVVVIVCVLTGCFVAPQGVVLYDGIVSYSSFDELNKKYVFSVTGSHKTNDEDDKVITAVTDYPFFGEHKGRMMFVFLNDQLAYLHFYSDDIEPIAEQYFPFLEGEGEEKKHVDGFVSYWKVRNWSDGKKMYIGVADTRLREEYLDATYFD